MDSRTFAENLFTGVVVRKLAMYRKLLCEIKAEHRPSIPYWKSAIAFFDSLDQNQQETFFSILKEVSIGTVLDVAGAIDGSSDIGLNEKVRLVDSTGRELSGHIQDHFLGAANRGR